MRPRLWDDRVGFFRVGFTDFGDDSDHEAKTVRYITRWRLDKKNPKEELSEPVKPIVWYVSREVPEKWQSYCIKGIEAWQPAFEAAGFQNAIVGKLAPTKHQIRSDSARPELTTRAAPGPSPIISATAPCSSMTMA